MPIGASSRERQAARPILQAFHDPRGDAGWNVDGGAVANDVRVGQDVALVADEEAGTVATSTCWPCRRRTFSLFTHYVAFATGRPQVPISDWTRLRYSSLSDWISTRRLCMRQESTLLSRPRRIAAVTVWARSPSLHFVQKL